MESFLNLTAMALSMHFYCKGRELRFRDVKEIFPIPEILWNFTVNIFASAYSFPHFYYYLFSTCLLDSSKIKKAACLKISVVTPTDLRGKRPRSWEFLNKLSYQVVMCTIMSENHNLGLNS